MPPRRPGPADSTSSGCSAAPPRPDRGRRTRRRHPLSQPPGVTAVVLSGGSPQAIGEAGSTAWPLQPLVVVVEERLPGRLVVVRRSAAHPLLAHLLNEMDGLGADANVTFPLTSSQAHAPEDASRRRGRPGIDDTARLPLPDAAARRLLVRLYQGGLHIGRTSAMTAGALAQTACRYPVVYWVVRSPACCMRRCTALTARGRPAPCPGGGAGPPANGAAPHPGPVANGVAASPGVPLRVTGTAADPGPRRTAGQQPRPDPGPAGQPPR